MISGTPSPGAFLRLFLLRSADKIGSNIIKKEDCERAKGDLLIQIWKGKKTKKIFQTTQKVPT